VKRISLLPNLLTLANCWCGLLAISKGIDALSLPAGQEATFYSKMESAAWLIFLAMIFDALDGKIARLTKSFSDFGAQLDSFADAVTFGIAPALLARFLIEHEGPLMGMAVHPRLLFVACAAFSLMAILRLVRFNLESDHDAASHNEFRGLPSPAAAGTLTATILMYLSLMPGVEVSDGTPTPVGRGLELLPEALRTGLSGSLLPLLIAALPLLGLLMVSRVRYVHLFSALTGTSKHFFTLVALVFVAFLLYSAPVPFLFFGGYTFVCAGIIRSLRGERAPGPARPRP
jgi:CDP-diacylglycerol--serine O-phosphatidyltransferase